MDITPKEAFYFSDNFLVQLRFDSDSSVDGWLVHYPVGLGLAEKFHGISIEQNGIIKLVFFIEWTNPNVNRKVLTAYAGEISKSEGDRSQLHLEWLQLNSNNQEIGSFSYKGSELLYDLAESDLSNEERKRTFCKLQNCPDRFNECSDSESS